MQEFENKLVAVLNKNVDHGKVMNALAHMCIGFGAVIGQGPLRLTHYQDADGGSHPYISEMPFIILSANSNKIKKLREDAMTHQIQCVDFTDTMTIGTYQEQIERTRNTAAADLEYYGVVLHGDWAMVSELTRKFSLWK